MLRRGFGTKTTKHFTMPEIDASISMKWVRIQRQNYQVYANRNLKLFIKNS